MQVVYSNQRPPETFTKSIFLAGPTPRSEDVYSWRIDALRILEQLNFDGVVFVPEFSTGKPTDYDAQVDWEKECLTMADRIVFWVPRELKTMPAFTTNVEFGTWIDSRKVVFGCPEGSPKNTYLKWLYQDRGYGEPYTGLETMLNLVVEDLHLRKCKSRTGAERNVPLEMWSHQAFNAWYWNHKDAGNKMLDAKVLFRFDFKGVAHSFVLWAKMYIADEDRVKENEFVVFRPPIVNVVAYLPGQSIWDTKVVMVREFRTPVCNSEGYVTELPGGSSWNPKDSMKQVAVDELAEEAGVHVDPTRLKPQDSRQVYATMLAHHSFVYSLELTQEEFDKLNLSDTFGVSEDSEQTTVRVKTVHELLNETHVDWSTLGMVFRGLSCLISPGPAQPLPGNDISL
jgi:8-oxo-dGTP pyrophosphatase MutT (NUDIX family)